VKHAGVIVSKQTFIVAMIFGD